MEFLGKNKKGNQRSRGSLVSSSMQDGVELLTEHLFSSSAPKSQKPKRKSFTIDLSSSDILEVLEKNGTFEAEKPDIVSSVEVPKSSIHEAAPIDIPPEPLPAIAKATDTTPVLCLLVEMTPGAPNYWILFSNKEIKPSSKAPEAIPLVSISPFDIRLNVESPLSDHAASRRCADAAFEPVSVVNNSRKNLTLYATPSHRRQALGSQAIPGGLILDTVSAGRTSTVGGIFGWNLTDSAGKTQILALYHRAKSGYVHGPYLKVNPKNVSHEIIEYQKQNSLPSTSAPVLFDASDLLGGLSQAKPYPIAFEKTPYFKQIVWLLLLGLSLVFAVSTYQQVKKAEHYSARTPASHLYSSLSSAAP